MDIFSEAFSAASGSDFDEIPVDITEFVTSPAYLNQPPLSPAQTQMVEAGSQIFKRETLAAWLGEREGERRYAATRTEAVFALGKGCTAPYTPVYNPESGRWQRMDSFTTDGHVVSSDGSIRYATESFLEGYGRMVRVKTSLGFEEDVYVGHKYLSYAKSSHRGYKPDFIEVQNLDVGDRIAIGVGFDVNNPINIPVEHAELIGYWLGDGGMPTDKNPSINMDFCSDETESIARYEELCAYIGDSPVRYEHPTKNMTIFKHDRNSKAVALAIEYGLWNMRSHTKYIPDVVWSSDNTIITAVVSKLWQTGGHVYDKNGGTAEFVSESHRLAEELQKMLLRLGIPSGISTSEAAYVTVSGQECFNTFCDTIALLDHKRPAILKKSRLEDDMYYDRIISIEDIGEGEYWTRTVPDTHNYIGNGFISHQSGKDHTSTIICAYVAYLLLCLKDPQSYYGKPPGDSIDIMNIAINAQQANRVFFRSFAEKIKRSPWFQGKFDQKQGEINFNKNINVISGHSESESLEGYNVIVVVLDEIDGFATETTTGNKKAVTAQSTYDMHRASVDSRFPFYGKVLLLSFPRSQDGFIMKRYNQMVAEKEIVLRSHTFKVDDDLPDGTESNEFTIEWEEDHIVRYTFQGFYAFKRPTWDVNPTKTVEDFKRAFYMDRAQALQRFACMPEENDDTAWIKNRDAIEQAFCDRNGVDSEGVFLHDFVADQTKDYFIHVDLSKVHDRCAVSLAHVDKWVTAGAGYGFRGKPLVRIDAVRWWQPSKDRPMEYQLVIDYIVSLRNRGFGINLVTFDSWNSHDTINQLNGHGIKTEMHGLRQPEYDDFLSALYDQRVIGPDIEELKKELKQLQWIKNKVDHPRTGYKDITDSVVGAVSSAISHTSMSDEQEIEVVSIKNFNKDKKESSENDNIIKPPKRKMPQDLVEALDDQILSNLRLL